MSKDEIRLGLCLSGGGFRAALFHIGTLAALAERELLHKVEVLSTVSGGSIIGAYYYLKIKQLLEGKRPGCPAPSPSIYIEIIKEIERDFLAAVQKNLRARLFLKPIKTARMLLDENYSRSDRMAELLDEHFYNSIALVDRIKLKDIHITPGSTAGYLNEKGKFSAKIYNENVQYKIPVLTINATCLNTGHPWEFTGSWMGEAKREGLYNREQNSNQVLPRLRFDGSYEDDWDRKVEGWQQDTMGTICLSDAVAASAAVPGIFPPLPIHDLYRNNEKNDFVVELSDGGVFDNQGLVALLSARCTHVFVSDASGQLADESLLSTSLVNVVQRANDVMMERIRGYGYFDLGLRPEVSKKIPVSDILHSQIYFVQESAYTHLREVAPQDGALPGPGDRVGGMVYSLSAMRTDLDAFSDIEACTLMYQAYALATDKLGRFCADCEPRQQNIQQWGFLEIADLIKSDPARVAKHLSVARNKFCKTYRLAPVRSWAWLLFLLSPFIAAAVYWLGSNWTMPIKLSLPHITVGEFFGYAAVALIAMVPMSARVRARFKTIQWLRMLIHNRYTNAGLRIMGTGVALVAMSAWILVFIYLNIFNPVFLKVGKLKLK